MDSVGRRLNYLDNLKLVLTMSVIVFHVAVIYGPIGGWYYYERGNDLTVNIPLASIVIYLDAFFMSLFFFISGYVTPSEYDRKGVRSYFYSKLKRLGIPLLIFIFTLSPVQEFIKMRYVEHAPFSFVGYYTHDVLTLRSICPGQLWFVFALLVFSIAYMFFREIFRNWRERIVKTPLSLSRTLVFALFLSIGVSSLRQIFPAGREYFHFIIGNFGQYVTFFIIGIVAARHDWINSLPSGVSRFWRCSLAVLAPLPFIIIVKGGVIESGTDILSTGVSWQFYAFNFWQMFFCVAMIITLLVFFKNRLARRIVWSRDAYAAYIIHPLTTIPYALLIMGLDVSPFLKFGIVGLCGIVTSFIAARFVARKLPFAGEIL